MNQDDLKQSFTEGLFLQINEQLIDGEFKTSQLSIIPDNSRFITNTKYYGNYDDLDLHILTVEHSSTEDARVGVSLDIFKLMKKYSLQNALVAAYSKSDNWRYSLITSNLSVNDKGKVTKEFSNPRRYSFVLGPNQKVLTPYKQLVQSGKISNIEGLSKRFSLEVVNNEFYREIAKLYDELVGTEKVARKLNYPSVGDESHEFAVRLIGRIIFCWFLREKKSNAGVSLVPSSILSRVASNESNYYHNILATLFFEVLNKPISKRTDKFQKGAYKDIPYLNGGLFSDDGIDHYKFDKDLELSVRGLVDVPDTWLHDLFDLLERFNFTVDENTSYDTDLSIDPEMLGRVFENLLARINPETGETVRKSTGSFYTPREIVEYMVDSSLSEYLVSKTDVSREKIEALVSYDLFDDLENKLSEEESILVLEALSTLTVLDPACGSGAFPIGMLQKIVFIISQLDPKAEWWLAKQLEGASPELRREFANRSVDYVRKLGIIRQTIFGVDIQPIATEISRLRCFLTLIVDEAVDDTQENRGIKPLPNLDFKFVTANSLITLPKSDDKKSHDAAIQAEMFEETSHIDDLKQIRNDYFSSTNHERSDLQLQFGRLQKKMVLTNVDVFRGSASKLYDTLSRWDPFEHKPSTWFDPGWMFGINNGFDIVIANPPYVEFKNLAQSTKETLKNFRSTRGKYDLYIPFLELSSHLIKKSGISTFICPTRFLKRDYGKALRELFAQNLSFIEMIDFSDLQVFQDAINYTGVFTFTSQRKKDTFIYKRFKADLDPNTFAHLLSSATPSEKLEVLEVSNSLLQSSVWNFNDRSTTALLGKISENTIPLKKLCTGIFQGISTGKDSVFIIQGEKAKKLKLESNALYKMLKGKDVGSYYFKWSENYVLYPYNEAGKVIDENELSKSYPRLYAYLTSRRAELAGRPYFEKSNKCWYELWNQRNLERFLQPKIVTLDNASKNSFAFDKTGEYLGTTTTYSLILKEKSQENYYFMVGILNSKLLDYYHKQTTIPQAGGFYRYQKLLIEDWPIRHGGKLSAQIADKARKIIEAAPNISGVKNYHDELNELVYRLYDITPEEIAVIEGSKTRIS